MKLTSRVILLAGLLIACQLVKAEEPKLTKEDAIKVCESQAIESYGEAKVTPKAKSRRIGPDRGYAVSVKVNGRKKLTCFASFDGEVRFLSN